MVLWELSFTQTTLPDSNLPNLLTPPFWLVSTSPHENSLSFPETLFNRFRSPPRGERPLRIVREPDDYDPDRHLPRGRTRRQVSHTSSGTPLTTRLPDVTTSVRAYPKDVETDPERWTPWSPFGAGKPTVEGPFPVRTTRTGSGKGETGRPEEWPQVWDPRRVDTGTETEDLKHRRTRVREGNGVT